MQQSNHRANATPQDRFQFDACFAVAVCCSLCLLVILTLFRPWRFWQRVRTWRLSNLSASLDRFAVSRNFSFAKTSFYSLKCRNDARVRALGVFHSQGRRWWTAAIHYPRLVTEFSDFENLEKTKASRRTGLRTAFSKTSYAEKNIRNRKRIIFRGDAIFVTSWRRRHDFIADAIVDVNRDLPNRAKQRKWCRTAMSIPKMVKFWHQVGIWETTQSTSFIFMPRWRSGRFHRCKFIDH